MYDTGENIEDADTLNYVGTFQSAAGVFVFHVFEEIGGRS